MHAISWGSNGSGNGGEDLPPPKPSRVPAVYGRVGVRKPVAPASVENSPGPTTYLVAPNSEVLAQLMRDNENRAADAGMYTAPASAFNTFTVEFTHPSSPSNPASPQHKSKTKGRKQQQQPVYANIMMADAAGPAANFVPAPVKDVRTTRSRYL